MVTVTFKDGKMEVFEDANFADSLDLRQMGATPVLISIGIKQEFKVIAQVASSEIRKIEVK